MLQSQMRAAEFCAERERIRPVTGGRDGSLTARCGAPSRAQAVFAGTVASARRPYPITTHYNGAEIER